MSHFKHNHYYKHVKQWLCRLFTHIKPLVSHVGSTVLDNFSPMSTSVNKWSFTSNHTRVTVLNKSLLFTTVYEG